MNSVKWFHGVTSFSSFYVFVICVQVHPCVCLCGSVPYLHVVKEGESLSKIAERYAGTQSLYPRMTLYDETSGETEAFDNPDVVYPGQKVTVPSMKEYDGRKCGAENLD